MRTYYGPNQQVFGKVLKLYHHRKFGTKIAKVETLDGTITALVPNKIRDILTVSDPVAIKISLYDDQYGTIVTL